jgi:hypothetical protein
MAVTLISAVLTIAWWFLAIRPVGLYKTYEEHEHVSGGGPYGATRTTTSFVRLTDAERRKNRRRLFIAIAVWLVVLASSEFLLRDAWVIFLLILVVVPLLTLFVTTTFPEHVSGTRPSDGEYATIAVRAIHRIFKHFRFAAGFALFYALCIIGLHTSYSTLGTIDSNVIVRKPLEMACGRQEHRLMISAYRHVPFRKFTMLGYSISPICIALKVGAQRGAVSGGFAQ